MSRYPQRLCEECGEVYLPKQYNQRRCSALCTDRWRSRRAAQRRIDRRVRGCSCSNHECNDCQRRAVATKRQREWYAENALRIKLAAYSLTAEEFEGMLSGQGGVCAICGMDGSDDVHGRLVPDHDHSCCPGRRSCGRCLRGLLCLKCNTAIAMLGDSPDRTRAAVAYLERFEGLKV